MANQNLQLPGGNVGQGTRELTVRMKGRVNSVPEFNDVLDTQRQLFAAEIALAQTQRAQLVAIVQLYKALGGGWS